MGGGLYVGCGNTNHETKTQNIINTEDIINKKTDTEPALLQVTMLNKEDAEKFSSLYESIDICNDTDCFRASVIDMPTDMIVANIAIENLTQSLKYVSYQKRDKSLYDSHFYYLSKEMNLTEGLSYKLFLDKDKKENTLAFKPKLITMFSPLDTPYFCSPQNKYNIHLKDDFELNIQKNTFTKPLTININIEKNNNGITSKYYLGLVEENIIPQKEITIFLPINDSNLTKEEIQEQYELQLNNEKIDYTLIEKNNKLFYKSKILKFGYIKSSKITQEKTPLTLKALNRIDKLSNKKILKNNINTCLNEINYWKDTITYYTEANGYYQFNGCSRIEPSIYIVSLNLDKRYNEFQGISSKKMKIDMAIDLHTVNNELRGQLHTIDKHAYANHADIAINGFRWDVEGNRLSGRRYSWNWTTLGFTDEIIEYKKPIGKVIFHTNQIPFTNFRDSENYSPIAIGISSSGDSKIYSIQNYENLKYPYTYSSYTSKLTILHNGQCNSYQKEKENYNKWSAIGVKDGKMLMISSNHDEGDINTEEMCQIFKAFGYENAVKNDGGGATSLYVRGQIVNPLSGIKRVIFGGNRNILYAITAKVVN